MLVRGYQERAFSHNTVKAYKVHRKSYLSFCLQLGERPVPASPLLLCRYVAFLAKRLKFSSVRQYLNVVGLLHKECGLPNPLLNNYRVLMTLRGVHRVLGWLVEWGFYAMSASKAIFRARTYNCAWGHPMQEGADYACVIISVTAGTRCYKPSTCGSGRRPF